MSIHIGFKLRETGEPTDPTPAQRTAIDIAKQEDTEVLTFVGGTRGGKTSGAIGAMIELCLEQPGQTWLFGHKTFMYIWASLLDEFMWQVPENVVDNETGQKYNLWEHSGLERRLIVRIPGAIHPVYGYTIKIFYRPLDPKRDLAKDLSESGLSLNGAILDQFEKLSYEAYKAVFTRLSNEPRKLFLTINPPDMREKPWYWDFLIEEEKRKLNPGWERRKVVYMNQDDNPYISKNYGRGLEENLSESDKARLLHGQISTSRGLVYPQLTRDHIVQPEEKIPVGSLFMEIGDWGYTDGALCQYWVKKPNQSKWRLWDSVGGKEEAPKVFGRRVLEKRFELMSAGRLHGEALPTFIGSRWDPSIFHRLPDGNTVARQFMEIQPINGMRLVPMPVSKSGYNTKEGLVHAQVMRVIDLLLEEIVEFSEKCSDFFEQHLQYFWKDKSDIPNEYRVFGGLEREVIHHFEHMVCLRYFGWTISPTGTIEDKGEDGVLTKIPHHEFETGPKNLHSPFERFRKKLTRVPTVEYR